MEVALTSRQNPLSKITLGMVLSVLLIIALGFRATGGSVHEWNGLLWCILVVVHCWWGRRWFTVFFRGKYSFRRIAEAVVILLLALGMATICITGLMNSSHILGFMKLDGNFLARQIHTIASYWTLVLAGIHLGVRWKKVACVLRVKLGWPGASARTRAALRILAAITACAGIWASFDRAMGAKLFYGSVFDFWSPDRPGILFFAANFAILGVYALVTYMVFAAVRKRP